MENQLLEFVSLKLLEGAKIILVGKKEIKSEIPQGVYRLDSLIDDPESILQSICGKNRRMLSNNIELQDLELIDGIELHCQGGIIENGSIWIKKDSNIPNESYQLISKAKSVIPILYEDDIYTNINSLVNKWGNLNNDYFLFKDIEHIAYNEFQNAIKTNNQTIIIFISSY